MDDLKYRELAARTEADQQKILDRLANGGPALMRLDNGARGLASEAGEVSDAVLKHVEYGKPLDFTNLEEEVGGCLWRLEQVCRAAEALSGRPFNLSTAKEANIRQLVARYGEKYTDHAARNRDKAAERAALEGPSPQQQAERVPNPVAAGRPDVNAFSPRPEDPSEDARERPC